MVGLESPVNGLNSIHGPQDNQAHQTGELAAFTSDTVEHDILPLGGTEVAVYNLCTDTTRHMNGVVTNMHPSEGVWLFRYYKSHHAQDQHCRARHEAGHDPRLVVPDLRHLEEATGHEAVVLLGRFRSHGGVLGVVGDVFLAQAGVAQVAQEDQPRDHQGHP